MKNFIEEHKLTTDLDITITESFQNLKETLWNKILTEQPQSIREIHNKLPIDHYDLPLADES